MHHSSFTTRTLVMLTAEGVATGDVKLDGNRVSLPGEIEFATGSAKIRDTSAVLGGGARRQDRAGEGRHRHDRRRDGRLVARVPRLDRKWRDDEERQALRSVLLHVQMNVAA